MGAKRIFDDAGALACCPRCGGAVEIVRRGEIAGAAVLEFACATCGSGELLYASRHMRFVYWQRRGYRTPWLLFSRGGGGEPWGTSSPW